MVRRIFFMMDTFLGKNAKTKIFLFGGAQDKVQTQSENAMQSYTQKLSVDTLWFEQ